MTLVVFGLFHLLLSNFYSFVLCANLLVYVVASPFFLNYLLTLAYFYYIHTPHIFLSLGSGIPDAQLFRSLTLLKSKKRHVIVVSQHCILSCIFP